MVSSVYSGRGAHPQSHNTAAGVHDVDIHNVVRTCKESPSAALPKPAVIGDELLCKVDQSITLCRSGREPGQRAG